VTARTLGLVPGGQRGSGVALDAWRQTHHWGAHSLALACYARGDRTAPRLVLVHGTPGSAQGWARYLLAPPPGCEVMAFDRPGFGASAPLEAVCSLAAQADAVQALLPDEERGVVLLGHSLGGTVAAAAAARAQPGRVRALVLLAAALDPALERVHPLQRLGAARAVRALLPRAIRNANAELMALGAELMALAPQLARIGCPVFIAHGSDDDLVPAANVRYLQSRLTGARHLHAEVVRGGNHFLPWEAEGLVRRVIAMALAEVRR
jgi:pimeloyl-ACP methyl ester carboxylesterase